MADGATTLASDRTDAPAGGDGEAAPVRALALRQLEQLGEMVDIGLKIMRAIERQVDAAGDAPQPLAELNAAAMAYARVARAVRQSVMLQDRLSEERRAGESAAAALRARQDRVRARVAGIVRRAVQAEHDDAEQVERLCAEAAERLEQERFGEEEARPIREVVGDICQALGLHPDWPDLATEIWAAEEMAQRILDDDASPDAEPDTYEVFWLDDEGRPVPAGGRRDSA
jgi:hypothetical protein